LLTTIRFHFRVGALTHIYTSFFCCPHVDSRERIRERGEEKGIFFSSVFPTSWKTFCVVLLCEAVARRIRISDSKDHTVQLFPFIDVEFLIVHDVEVVICFVFVFCNKIVIKKTLRHFYTDDDNMKVFIQFIINILLLSHSYYYCYYYH
jgi:hypothetical protein